MELSAPDRGIDDLLTGYINAYNSSFASGNPDRWVDVFAEDAELKFNHELTLRGKAAIRGWAEDQIRGGWSKRYTERTRIVQGNVAVQEMIYHGLHRGKRVEVSQVVVLKFNESGKVMRARYYVDYNAWKQFR